MREMMRTMGSGVLAALLLLAWIAPPAQAQDACAAQQTVDKVLRKVKKIHRTVKDVRSTQTHSLLAPGNLPLAEGDPLPPEGFGRRFTVVETEEPIDPQTLELVADVASRYPDVTVQEMQDLNDELALRIPCPPTGNAVMYFYWGGHTIIVGCFGGLGAVSLDYGPWNYNF